ncbi:MAG: translation initiation factor IF-2, partial [Candidatus Kerfeldbacteria bacterium]|nr:translation initiation factor IF-2 [Candidatus Kerfeldbacteria bacterium]
ELARRLKIPTQQLKDELPKLGFDIGRRAIKIDDAVAEKVAKLWSERQRKLQANQYVVVEKRLSEGVESKEAQRQVALPPTLTPREFANLLGYPVTTIVGELFKNGIMASINERIDFETASIIAQDLGFATKPLPAAALSVDEQTSTSTLLDLMQESDSSKLRPRPPIVVVMGHVDHGKTTLLDAIRSTNVAAGESGAITQHIGAYQVEEKGKKITFLDTPGHEAFTAMRARGGRLADVAIIVVAADDGLQPQTLEAVEIAQREKLAWLIAINKVDKDTADIERIKKSLAEINLLPEDWGGKTICVPISAKKQQGISELLDMVLLLAEMEKLQANPDRLAAGTIIESHLDIGEGPVATALVQTGILKVGDHIIAGSAGGKVKALKDFRGNAMLSAPPSTPVRILGLKQVPQAGDILKAVADEAEVREVLHKSHKFQRAVALPSVTSADESEETGSAKVTLNLILRADVLGSREAIVSSLKQLNQADATVKIVRTGLGNVTENDIIQAEANKAIILGFHVPLVPAAEALAKSRGIHVKTYDVIYDLIDDVKQQLSALLKPELIRSQIGEAQVVAIFRRGKRDMIVGCRVTKGVVRNNSKARVWRAGNQVTEASLSEVRLGREVVGEVAQGGECGLHLLGEPLLEVGDILEVYHEEVHARVIT